MDPDPGGPKTRGSRITNTGQKERDFSPGTKTGNKNNPPKHELHFRQILAFLLTFRVLSSFHHIDSRPEPKHQVKDQRIQIAPIKIKFEAVLRIHDILVRIRIRGFHASD
jgi:hypothetical protein